MKPLIAVVGNTGVGKSQFAVEIAKALNGEIINGDAMQMYQGLDVMTNKHPIIERHGVPHHFIDNEPWSKQLTVQDFESRAVSLIDHLHAQNKTPILVGGTHYYIQSLLAENATIHKASATEDVGKKKFSNEQLAVLENPSQVEAVLKEVDPVIAAKFHPNDTRRLRRALEVWFETGKKPSDIYESQVNGSGAERLQLRYDVLTFWIWCQKPVLEARLDNRVDEMLEHNLLDEVKQLYEQYNPEVPKNGVWQVLGFSQFLSYMKSPTAENLELGINAMKVETRQYAKKQSKWIRNKLLPMLENLGGAYALLDSTDLDKFDEEVSRRGVIVAQNWLKGNQESPEFPLVPKALVGETERRRQTFSRGQWVRHRCDVCSTHRNADVVVVGDEDWEIHLSSRQHRAATRRKARGSDLTEETG